MQVLSELYILSDGKERFAIETIVYFPRSKKGKDYLAKRVATVHAQMVLERVSRLNCPTYQKVALIDAVQNSIRADIRKEKEGRFLNLSAIQTDSSTR